MSKIKVEWKVDAQVSGVPVMKSCSFKHDSGFSWSLSVSAHGTDPNKFFMHSKHLGYECQPIGTHDGWGNAQKMALKIGSILFREMMAGCEDGVIDLENEAAKAKLDKIGMSNLDLIEAGTYVKTNDGKRGWIIDLTKFDPVNPISSPGIITVFFDDNTEDYFEHWNWPDYMEITECPYVSAKNTTSIGY